MANGDNALLTRASVSFHTNDEDKDNDTLVEVDVKLIGGALVARIQDDFAHFADNSDAGPFDMILASAAKRGDLKLGSVTLNIRPNGNDTWRMNFFVDLLFDDGAHLFSRANGLELTESNTTQSFGLE
jgi:hypothetical protein